MSKPSHQGDREQQHPLDQVRLWVASPPEVLRIQRLLEQHHYLGRIRPVGERLYYVASDSKGKWLAVLVLSTAAKHLKHRDRWIGWTAEQRRRRLSLITNNSRFLLLPHSTVPNLGSRVLRLALDRLAHDWHARYGHPVLAVETFVDPAQFQGTVYAANGWIELGQTGGWGRCRRDSYVKHDQPKRLLVRALTRTACRTLQAERLRPELAPVEANVPVRCTHRVGQIRTVAEHFKTLPEYRQRIESYPLFSLASQSNVAAPRADFTPGPTHSHAGANLHDQQGMPDQPRHTHGPR
jgi:hypothetical protein